MYIKQTNKAEPITIVITKEEMKEAFKSPISYEMFRQNIMSQLLMYHLKAKVEHEQYNDIIEE